MNKSYDYHFTLSQGRSDDTNFHFGDYLSRSTEILSSVGAVLILKLIPLQDRLSLRVVTQPTLNVTGMMFSVLPGFFIAESLKSYSSINVSLVNEANAVGEVFRDARGLPEKDRKRIRRLCRAYIDSVINDE